MKEQVIACDFMKFHIWIFFYWHRVYKEFTPIIPGGAPRVIQRAIKFPQTDGQKGTVATQTQDIRVYNSPQSWLTTTPTPLWFWYLIVPTSILLSFSLP